MKSVGPQGRGFRVRGGDVDPKIVMVKLSMCFNNNHLATINMGVGVWALEVGVKIVIVLP
jgi:hypothetical protein